MQMVNYIVRKSKVPQKLKFGKKKLLRATNSRKKAESR